MSPARVGVFRQWFGLTTAQALLLDELFAANGEPVMGLDLARRASITRGGVSVMMVALRQTLEAEAIDTTCEGYSLTPSGLAECRGALWQTAEELKWAS